MHAVIAERFWAKVRKRGPRHCWPWIGALGSSGEGVMKNGDKEAKAARLSWELAHGPIPPGLLVIHTCVSLTCVNPAHLVLGSRAECAAARARKGQAARVLTESDVVSIRARCARGESQQDVATAFGLHYSMVSLIVSRKRWNHLKEP